ncbi:MAG: hypothetical protein AAGE52_13090 [Myxococcota bacterium]
MIQKVVSAAIWVALAGCTSNAQPERSADSNRSADSDRSADSNRSATNEWSGVVDCDYNASHGWGHVYRCGVRHVRDGTPSSSELFLNVAISDEWLPDNEQAPLRGVLMRFRRSARPYGPPSGYRDAATSRYYVLLSAAQP